MISVLYILTVGLLSGTAFLLLELYFAPEGFQTSEGFNIVWKNNSPDLENVSCIW